MKIKRFGGSILIILGLAGLISILIWQGVWIPNYPSKASYSIRGIDVSHHQGAIDWGQVKQSGIKFTFIKATEGRDYVDPTFLTNWKTSAKTGVLRGAYHFFTFGTPGKSQAHNFVTTVPNDSDALPPAIDLEFSGYNLRHRPSRQEFARELAAFYDEVFARYGKTPVIYTTSEFRAQYLAGMPVERLWIRNVFTKPGQESEPWVFWQFSSRGRIRGVSMFVDLNVFNGSAEEFETFVRDKR